MDKPPGIKWLFLDLNSYFASVEQQETPALRGKPVAVVPMDTESTCAIAASYEAKKYGIKTGTKIYDAKEMCPQLTCVLARHDVYVDYHHRILEEAENHIPVHKVWSIDEFDAWLSRSDRTLNAAIDLAHRLKRGLRDHVGEAIQCSIGLAPNSLLAKIATDMQKLDGLVILTQEELPGRLLDLALTDIPGIGVNMEKRLNKGGIYTMAQLWDISPKHARKIWGSVHGERMWYWLHGYDFQAPLPEKNTMIGHSRVLDWELRTPDKARQMARQLLFKATTRLRRNHFFAGTLSLGVTSVCGLKWRQEIRLSNPACDPFTMLDYLESLWSAMLSDMIAAGGTRVRFKKVSTLLMELRKRGDIMNDILDTSWESSLRQLHRRESLAKALDSLQDKYKNQAVSLGIPPKTRSGHVGTKIAFSRVPEREEFWSG